LQEAERLYRAVLQIQPYHADANHNLGVIAIQVKQSTAALPYFKAALEANPNENQFWLSYIDALIQAGQIDTARLVVLQSQSRGLSGDALDNLAAKLDLSEKIIPDKSKALECATEHREAGRYKEALFALQNWLVNNPQDASAYALLAHVLLLEKQDEQAWLAINKSLSINSALPIVQRNYARLLLKQRKTDEGFRAAKFAYESDTENLENQLVLAAALGQGDHGNEAMKMLDNVIQRNPNFAEAFATRALLKVRNNSMPGALLDAEKALSIKPHLSQLWEVVGFLRQQLKNLPGAIEAMQNALTYSPDNVGYMVHLGELKRQTGLVSESITLLEKAASIAPNNADVWVNLGTALQEIKRVNEAKDAYERALQILPDQPEVTNNLGVMAQVEGRLEEAVRYFKKAVEIKPNFAAAHCNLGVTLLELGQLGQASIRRALEINPANAEAHFSLGTTLRYLNDFPQAAAEYIKTVELDPANIGMGAAIYLAIMSYLDGNFDQSRKHISAAKGILTKPENKLDHSRRYLPYIEKLLSLRNKSSQDQNPNKGIFHVVGESHSLAAHGVIIHFNGQEMVCKAEWIEGCKQWHLGNDLGNKYKLNFTSIMSRLPPESSILLCFGEIDCRADDGILKAFKKYPNTVLADHVASTVNPYIEYVAALGRCYGHRIIISGVPCTNKPLEAMEANEAVQLVNVIRIFNESCKSKALETGMGFLDVYALTDRGDGIANGKWHLDEVHLLPSAIAEAFDKHCFEPEQFSR
jgi:tetratricopeptide (TPR) repeat protein